MDAGRLAADAPAARVLVVPSGMDCAAAAPAAQPGTDGTALLVANFGYGPNARGTDWFLRAIWPPVRARVPAAILRCVGARMPESLAALAAATPGVEVRGQVADLAPLLRDAGLVLAPILEGGGTRLKIVEAWSQGKAVVTTTKGVEGLPASRDVAGLADDAATFAATTAALLLDPERRREMGGRALELFRARLSWEVDARTVTACSVVAGARRVGTGAAR